MCEEVFSLVSLTVFFSNTEMSTVFLTESSPKSLYHSIQYSSRTIYLCWHYLTDAVRWETRTQNIKTILTLNSHWQIYVLFYHLREGKNQYEKAFGINSKDLFEALYRWESLCDLYWCIFFSVSFIKRCSCRRQVIITEIKTLECDIMNLIRLGSSVCVSGLMRRWWSSCIWWTLSGTSAAMTSSQRLTYHRSEASLTSEVQ